jgi:outer membrane protein assembly factor BamB
MVYRSAPSAHPLVLLYGTAATALDRETGALVWEYEMARRASRMAFAADRVFVLDVDCVVHCLDAHTGRLVGKVEADRAAHWGAALLLEGDRMYVATSGSVTCLSMDGAVLWKRAHDPAGAGVLAGLGVPGQVMQPDFKD